MSMTWNELEDSQPIAMKMLTNSLNKNRVAHAYLFEGEHGTGKKDASLLLAKRFFCTSLIDGTKPCGTCLQCRRIEGGNHPDIHLVEPDGLSIKKGQIKDLQVEFSKRGMESRTKVYTIVDADKMTASAANSLLKFLEEPHPGTTAILITEQIHRILPTIVSRCQTLSFYPLPPQILTKRLLEAQVRPELASLLPYMTNQFQEALELSNDEWFAQARKIVLKLYEVLHSSPITAMMKLHENFFGHFKEKQQIEQALDLFLLIYKDLLYIQLGKDQQLAYPDHRTQWEAAALHSSTRRLSEQMTSILEAKRKLNGNMNPQLLMEQLVLKLQGGSTIV